jgi:hypothetical protein|tara:strand:- start:43 stop:537 length:495 start_codon:yes stop_codon:yes gene_type:complete
MTEKILDRLNNKTYCRVQPSDIDGVGVFAIKDIPTGVAPWTTLNHREFGGAVAITIDKLLNIDESVRKVLLDYNLLDAYMKVEDRRPSFNTRQYVGEHIFIHPYEMEVLHISQFLNASTDPNLKLESDELTPFRTMREIKTGEELTVDYEKDLKETNCRYNYRY